MKKRFPGADGRSVVVDVRERGPRRRTSTKASTGRRRTTRRASCRSRTPATAAASSSTRRASPVLQSTFDMRFSLVVPTRAELPDAAGRLPDRALRARHRRQLRVRVPRERRASARRCRRKCVAAMGVDQIFHGARPGAPPPDDPNYENDIELLFFNFYNPIAARTNGRQGAVDVVQQARLFTRVARDRPRARLAARARRCRFDATKFMFVGHSQGGVNGPLFLGGRRSDARRRAVGHRRDDHRGAARKDAAVAVGRRRRQDAPRPQRAPTTRPSSTCSTRSSTWRRRSSIRPIPLHYMPYIIAHPRHGKPEEHLPDRGHRARRHVRDRRGLSGAPVEVQRRKGLRERRQLRAAARDRDRVGRARRAARAPGMRREIAQDAWTGITDVEVPAERAERQPRRTATRAACSGSFRRRPGSDGHFVVFDIPACSRAGGAVPRGTSPTIRKAAFRR